MSALKRLVRRYGVLLSNMGARVGALIVAAVTTFIVARTGGPALVGVLALLRVLPGLIGVVLSSGLPGAVTYFRAGPHRDDRRLPFTIVAMVAAGGAFGAVVWIGATPFLGGILFPNLSLGLVTFAGTIVLTKLCVATAKACLQGNDDLPGANRVIFAEEFMFLPAYGLMWSLGLQTNVAVVTGLILADLATATFGWSRLFRRGFFDGSRAPSLGLARRIASYGMRAQVGGVMSLLNLRLDFVLLTVMAGPAVLGVYAVASKFAELVKVPGLALTYVLYPRFARDPESAASEARKMLPRAALLTTGCVAPLWLATFLLPVVYGADFKGAVVPAQIILLGLMLEGVAGVISGFLYGTGRPGLNSWAMGAGLTVTLVLDLVLIPPYGATGAAIASAAAYITTQFTLLWFFFALRRSRGAGPDWAEKAVGANAR
jgi:O-antigen/teichoic acid export membrane protein